MSSTCAASTGTGSARWRGGSSAVACVRAGTIRAASACSGIGYATPYLGLFREEAERCLAFMPATQGVVKWPSAHPTLTALVEESELPLPDASFDRVLLVHAIENSHDVGCVAAGGLARAGSRRSAPRRCPEPARVVGAHGHDTVRPWPALFALADHPPLARDSGFTPTRWSEALYVPPIGRGWFLRSSVAWERTGATISAPFAGVHIVEATKQVYRAIPVRRERRRLMPALEPALAPSPGAAARVLHRPSRRDRNVLTEDQSLGRPRGADSSLPSPCAGTSPRGPRWRRRRRCSGKRSPLP